MIYKLLMEDKRYLRYLKIIEDNNIEDLLYKLKNTYILLRVLIYQMMMS